jgi:cytidyltransferase-like protein
MNRLFALDVVNKNQLYFSLSEIKVIGLYFGSFDPFHDGHCEVAEIMLNFCDLVLITTVHKNSNKPLLSLYEHRINLINHAIKDLSKPIFLVTNDLIEVINQLKNSFHLCGIMGSDVYMNFVAQKRSPKMRVDEWFIIPRQQFMCCNQSFFDKKTTFLDQSLFKKQMYSSTYIREKISQRKINQLPLCSENIKYIMEHQLYDINHGTKQILTNNKKIDRNMTENMTKTIWKKKRN